jgi:hypothetical protein
MLVHAQLSWQELIILPTFPPHTIGGSIEA